MFFVQFNYALLTIYRAKNQMGTLGHPLFIKKITNYKNIRQKYRFSFLFDKNCIVNHLGMNTSQVVQQ